MASGGPPLTKWAWIRAILITLVLVAQWADAMPLPELDERDLRNPLAQDELERWTGVLGQLGVELTPDELAQHGLELGATMKAGRKAVLSPWKPFRRLTGTGQGWGLFAYPDPYAGRLVVRARTWDGEWQTRYKVPDEGDEELAFRLSYRRVRGIWDDAGDRPKPRRLYTWFASWIAGELFEAEPDLLEVEVRIDMHRIILPREGPIPEEERRHVVVIRRGQPGVSP